MNGQSWRLGLAKKTYLITCCLAMSLWGCPSEPNPSETAGGTPEAGMTVIVGGEEAGDDAGATVSGTEAGDVAGDPAGDDGGAMVSGTTAGEVAGNPAGEVAGDTAGEVAGDTAGEVTDPCVDNPRAVGCACESDEGCDIPGICRDGLCTDCTGQEGCYCAAGQSCDMGLSCNDAGRCEFLCGNLNGPCCPADRSDTPCTEGFECVEDVCQIPAPCGGEGEACCDEGEQCADSGLRCNDSSVCESCAGQLGCACDADGACEGARCEASVCVACDGELGCPCDNGECAEGRCEANTCVACDGQAGCPCDNGECVDGLCGQDNVCVACEGQVGCACTGDGDCQAGLDCVNSNGALTCTDCAGEVGCSCDNGACAGNLICENNECAQPAVCPVGTEGCPCNGTNCDGALNCLDRDGDGEANCVNCLGQIGCFCDTGARCDAGAECLSGFCVEICDYAGCECEADGDCAAPLTCETTSESLRCTDCRGQVDCACDADGQCDGNAVCNEGACITFEAACELERGPGCACAAAGQECAAGSVCLDGACADCDGRNDLDGCPCVEGACAVNFYCNIDNLCVSGSDCEGDFGAECAAQNRACSPADGQRDASCAECLAGFLESEGACVICNADAVGCECLFGACDPTAGVFCGADNLCASLSASEQSCADQLRAFNESDGTADASCGDCLEDAREPADGETPDIEGACVSCLGEVGCSCDQNSQCDGDAVCAEGECITFEAACELERGAGCACDAGSLCAGGNVCVEGACVSCEGRNDLIDCPCLNGACDASSLLFCDNGLCAQGGACEGELLTSCDDQLRNCAPANGQVDARCTTCKQDLSVPQGELCHPCNADAVACPCVGGACQSAGDGPNSLYCAANNRCTNVTRSPEECAQRNRVYVSGGTTDATCGGCVEGAVEVDGECRVCNTANPQYPGCSCQGVNSCAGNDLFCSIGAGYTCVGVSATLQGCANIGEGYNIAVGTNDASCTGTCLSGYSRLNNDPANQCLQCSADRDPNCDGCVDSLLGESGQCRDKISCEDNPCQAGQLCTESGSLEEDDTCSSCPNGQEYDEISNSCINCPCSLVNNSTGQSLGTRNSLCICEPSSGNYLPNLDIPSGFVGATGAYISIRSCDEDNDGWINMSAYGTHPTSGEARTANGLPTVAEYNRCRLNVITQVSLQPSVSPRAEDVNANDHYRPAAYTETIQDIWTEHGLTQDPAQAAKLVVMVEPDKLDKAADVNNRNDNKLKLNNGQGQATSITPSALNPFTKACGKETDFNLSGVNNAQNDFIDRLQDAAAINPVGYNSDVNARISDLKLLMTDMNYYIELYHGTWDVCGANDVTCDSPKSELVNDVNAAQFALIQPVTYQIIERNRPTAQVIPNELSRVPFALNSEALNADDFGGWEECTVYGDTRTSFTTSQGVEIDLKLGNEFNNWRRDYTRSARISPNTNASVSAENMSSESFRTVLKHHSQFKCIELVSTTDFQRDYNLNNKYSQDTVLYFGNASAISVAEDVSEQALLDAENHERYARQTCHLSAQPTENGAFVPSADGKPVDISFECEHDTSAGSNKVQWAIVGYRDNDARKPVGNYDLDPMSGYVRGCINECAASRGRFLRACASYGIFNGSLSDEDRKEAVASCIDNMFNRTELTDDSADAPLRESMRAPYVCRGYDYDPEDPLAFIPTSCQSSNLFNGVQRCGCADGFNGVDSAGNLDCSYGCPGAVPTDGTSYVLSVDYAGGEDAWYQQILNNSNSNEDAEVLRYKKFIMPPDEYWMCLEPGAAGSEPLSAPEGACNEERACEVGGTCEAGTCVYPPATEFQVEFGGVPGVLSADPARPLSYNCSDNADCGPCNTDGVCFGTCNTDSVCVY